MKFSTRCSFPAVVGLFALACVMLTSFGQVSYPEPSSVQAGQIPVAAATGADQPAAVDSAGSAPEDWPHWRGPEHNGISRATGLVDNWNPRGGDGSNVVWARDDLGGRSTPVVLRGKIYMIVRDQTGTPMEGERVVCVDLETGETLWENRFNVWLSDVPDTRVGWSSCVADPETGNVYALGVCGYFQCLDAETGKTKWSVPMHEQFGLLSTYGGRTNFPMVCEDLVIVSGVIIGWGDMAKPAHRFLAFNKHDGQVVWFNGTRLLPYDTTYSTPTLTVLAGQKALVFGSGDGAIWAIQPRTGLPIWKYRFSRRGLNVSPLVVGDRVYSGHSEENIEGNTMGAVAAIDATGRGDVTETHEMWWDGERMMGKSSPIFVNGRLYCFDDRAKLHVYDAQTGDRVGRKISLGSSMRASPLYADGKIYALTHNGRWYILAPDKKRGARILRKGRMPAGEEFHASPICARGKILIPSTGKLYCLEDHNKSHGATEATPAPTETVVEDDPEVAHVQVVPAEVLMQSGQQQKFSVRLMNSRGQLLQQQPAQFSVDGPGEITSEGVFTAPASDKHVATRIVAQVREVVSHARIRIVPPLPWEFNFEDTTIDSTTQSGAPTVTWVGARYRHVVREIDGNQVMVKVTTIPKGTRSRCWFGQPELSDYTIQADVRGALTLNQMPDIGLIAHGYTLDLQGASQKLQIRSWVSQLRMARSVDVSWKPNTWYTLKLQASRDGDTISLKGKVWLRDEAEPENWTIKAVDPSPNLQGSPGLYGNAKVAEIYLDNIRVFSN